MVDDVAGKVKKIVADHLGIDDTKRKKNFYLIKIKLKKKYLN